MRRDGNGTFRIWKHASRSKILRFAVRGLTDDSNGYEQAGDRIIMRMGGLAAIAAQAPISPRKSRRGKPRGGVKIGFAALRNHPSTEYGKPMSNTGFAIFLIPPMMRLIFR
jgi:hypothetical protein